MKERILSALAPGSRSSHRVCGFFTVCVSTPEQYLQVMCQKKKKKEIVLRLSGHTPHGGVKGGVCGSK